MRQYAKEMGVNFWMENTDELIKYPKESWNEDLMNLELEKLVNNFTKESLDYCKQIIKKVYGINSQNNNPKHYNTIINSIDKINSIINKNKKEFESIDSWLNKIFNMNKKNMK